MTAFANRIVGRAAAALAGVVALSACSNIDLLSRGGGVESGQYDTASIPGGGAPAVETGVAGWNGDISSPGLTAAHPTMPLGAWARVTNAATGQSAVVRVTQRLAPGRGRDIELSRDAAAAVGALHDGLATVIIEPIDPRQASPDEQFWAADPAPVEAVEPTQAEEALDWDPNYGTASIPSPAVVDPAAGGGYYLQLGSFRDASNADRLLGRLRAETLSSGAYGSPFVESSRVGSRMFHRVRLGPIMSAAAADRALREARALGHTDAAILRR